jgi:hypothetical protein
VVTTTSFPAQYHLELYHPPPIESLFQPRWTLDKVAVATPMLYLDNDNDLTFSADVDKLVGGSPDVVLVWSGASSEPAGHVSDHDDFVDLKPGFQRMWANRPVCEGDRGITYFPAEDSPVDLWVGEYWDWFTDWDCDGATNEWLVP